MMVIHLVLLMVMVEVVLVLVPTTFPPRKVIFGLMVVILCHTILGCLYYDLILEAGYNYLSCMM